METKNQHFYFLSKRKKAVGTAIWCPDTEVEFNCNQQEQSYWHKTEIDLVPKLIK